MYEPLTEKQLRLMECWYNPIANIECLAPENLKAPQKWSNNKNFKCVKVRNYQHTMVDYSLMYADDPRKSPEENARIKRVVGTCYNIAARDVGKSYLLWLDAFIHLMHARGKESMLAAPTDEKLKKVGGVLVNLCQNHPFFKIFHKKGKTNGIKSQPLEIATERGHTLYGRNEKIDDPDPGKNFNSVHAEKIFYEEFSFATAKGTQQRVDSEDSLGCIERMSGIPDLRSGSPLGDVLNNKKLKSFVCRLPQSFRRDWNSATRQRKIDKYKGRYCFDDKTEVLTNSGWKRWFQISENDLVLSLDPKSKRAEYTEIKNIFIDNFSGYLNYYKNLYIDFAFTDDHRVLYKTLKNKNYRLNTLKKLIENKPERREPPIGKFSNCVRCGKTLNKIQKKFCSNSCQSQYFTWIYYPVDLIYIPSHFNWDGQEAEEIIFEKTSQNSKKHVFKIDDWLEFLGWYISEGNRSSTKRFTKLGKKYYSHGIDICQIKKEYVKEIKELFIRMGLSGNRNKYTSKFSVNSKSIYDWIINNCYDLNSKKTRRKTIYNSYNKKVPEFIKFLSPRQINIFLDAFNKGDGDGKRKRYYTSSYYLANDLQELIYKVGHGSTIQKLKSHMYVISEHLIDSTKVDKRKINKKHYSGKIWCVETEPHNTIFIRRNNKCMWSGNSTSYKLNVEGEILEGAFSKWDMDRIRKNCLKTDKHIKFFEINKEIFQGIEDFQENKESEKELLERLGNALPIVKLPSVKKIIASDIGTTGSPSEVGLFFGNKNSDFVYEYQISLFKMTSKEQAFIFNWLYRVLDGAFICVDNSNADGQDIVERLVKEYKVPRENISDYNAKSNTNVGWKLDENGKVLKDDKGKPLELEVYTKKWAVQQLETIFYDGKVDIPYDEKFLDQFANHFEKPGSSGRPTWGSSTDEHLVDMFLCFAFCVWDKCWRDTQKLAKNERPIGYI